jgi:hypothetical protein
VADRSAHDGEKLLTEREREVVRELAGEFVKEAGLKSDPQAEATREVLKSYVDTLKYFATFSGAAAVTIAAIQRDVELVNRSIGFTLMLLALSFLVAIVGLLSTLPIVYRSDDSDPSNLGSIVFAFVALSGLLLYVAVGTYVFGPYIFGTG